MNRLDLQDWRYRGGAEYAEAYAAQKEDAGRDWLDALPKLGSLGDDFGHDGKGGADCAARRVYRVWMGLAIPLVRRNRTAVFKTTPGRLVAGVLAEATTAPVCRWCTGNGCNACSGTGRVPWSNRDRALACALPWATFRERVMPAWNALRRMVGEYGRRAWYDCREATGGVGDGKD